MNINNAALIATANSSDDVRAMTAKLVEVIAPVIVGKPTPCVIPALMRALVYALLVQAKSGHSAFVLRKGSKFLYDMANLSEASEEATTQ